MVDLLKFYRCLDRLDPRVNPIPRESPKPYGEIVKQRITEVQLLLSLMDDSEQNVLRLKGRDVLFHLENERE